MDIESSRNAPAPEVKHPEHDGTSTIPALEVRGVGKTFTSIRGDINAIQEVSLDVAEGEFVTIVGPSGCGKSTLLNLLCGLIEPTRGEVLYRGARMHGPRPEIGYVTQRDTLFPWRTLLDNVAFALEVRGVPHKERNVIAQDLLEQVGLSGFEQHYPGQLSGGMRQRAMIVRSLAYDPGILLLDEPFGALDAQTRGILQNLLWRLHKKTGTTMVLVTHDLSEAIALGDRVFVLTQRPSTIASVYNVPLPASRNVFALADNSTYRSIFDAVAKDVLGDKLLDNFESPVRVESPTPAQGDGGVSWVRSMRQPARGVGSHLLFVILALALWQTISGNLVDKFWISSPIDIATALVEWAGTAEFWVNLQYTMTAVMLGFGIGCAGGILLAFLFGETPALARFADPYLTAAYGVPKTALAPLFVLWFGIGIFSKVVMAAVFVFFLAFYNTYAGVRDVDPGYIDAGRVAGAGRWTITRKIKIPAAMVHVLTGIKVSLPMALVGAIVSEFIASSHGLGYLILRSMNVFDTARTLGGILVLSLIVLLLNSIVTAMERWLFRWRDAS